MKNGAVVTRMKDLLCNFCELMKATKYLNQDSGSSDRTLNKGHLKTKQEARSQRYVIFRVEFI